MSAVTQIKEEKFNLLSFQGKYKTLHLTWLAFFLSFFVWFNLAPFATTIQRALELTSAQLKTLFICNVALTIPARIIIGMLVDKFGPRKTYSALLVLMSIPCFLFALSDTFTELVVYRLLLGIMGAGFVIGIRMIGEWFPARQIGVAEGIYGGWGNFGASAAAFALPTLALMISDVTGWRFAIGLSGALALAFGVLYYRTVRDTPSGKTYFKPKTVTALEVSNYKDLFGLIAMTLPMILCLGLLTWKLQLPDVGFITAGTAYGVYGLLALLFAYQTYQSVIVNRKRIQDGIHMADRYRFKQVVILSFAYAACFGSELAVVSMLPSFFESTFSLTIAQAGIIASSFPFMNLTARPGGGWLCDRLGRKRSLLILLSGLALTYMAMSRLNGEWSLVLAILLTMFCSFFVQASAGAVFAIVPLVKRRLTGQIAGMVGAYGNVGAVCFLTVYSFTDASTFFLVIGGVSVLSFISAFFLEEPKGHTMEVNPDGTMEMVQVS